MMISQNHTSCSSQVESIAINISSLSLKPHVLTMTTLGFWQCYWLWSLSRKCAHSRLTHLPAQGKKTGGNGRNFTVVFCNMN